MPRLRVLGTAIVYIRAGAALCHLCFAFPGDRMPAMGAGYQLATVSKLVAVVILPAEKNLHPIPCRPVDQPFMLAGIPFALVENLADVGPILQNGVNRASRELRLRRTEDQTFGVDPLDQAVEREVFVGVEMENAFDVRCGLRINLNHAATVLADVAVAVGTA